MVRKHRTTIDHTISGFAIYERRDFGFTIQYPPDWVMDYRKYYNPYDERFTQVVGFLIPSYNQLGQLREIVSIQISVPRFPYNRLRSVHKEADI